MDLKNKSIDHEHWDIKNGDFAGLWSIDPTLAKGADMWAKIEEIITSYTKLHPLEIELQVRANQERSSSLLTETGANSTGTMRIGMSIPAGLMFKIQQVYPEVFSNKDLFHKFLRKYKGFTICSRV